MNDVDETNGLIAAAVKAERERVLGIIERATKKATGHMLPIVIADAIQLIREEAGNDG